MPATPLSQGLYSVFGNITGSADEARKQIRAAQVEDAYAAAVRNVFSQAAGLVLKHTNAVYCFEEKGAVRFLVYADDSSIRSSLDARQGLLKIALAKQGVEFAYFKTLPSQKSIKSRHPFAHVTVSDPPRPLKELSEEEMRKVDAFCAPIDDPGVRESFKRAVTSVLRASNDENQ